MPKKDFTARGTKITKPIFPHSTVEKLNVNKTGEVMNNGGNKRFAIYGFRFSKIATRKKGEDPSPPFI